MANPVLLHGFTGRAQSWGDAVVDGLASAGLAPVLLDAPGHGGRAGDTDPADFTWEAVHALIGEALGEEPGPLVGYSMGGRLALSYAVAHPGRVTRLVLESASPGLASQEEREARRAEDEALASWIEERGVRALVERWESLELFASQARLPDEVRRRQRALRAANDPASLATSLRHLGTGAQPSHWEALPSLDVPTLLVVGELDAKFVGIARRMAESLPRAELLVVPDAGHTVHLERPGAWLDAVVAFLGGRSGQ